MNKLITIIFILSSTIILHSQTVEPPAELDSLEYLSKNTSTIPLSTGVYPSIKSNPGNNIVINTSQAEGHFSISKSIQSKEAGLLINANSFSPGASSNINIRGRRSTISDNQPLILLDGMPIDNSEWGAELGGVDKSNRLIDIDPNYIESIEVINSPVARSMYGVNGGNGILSIKTKNLSLTAPKISLNTGINVSELSNIIELQNSRAQGRIVNGEAIYSSPNTSERLSWGPLLSELEFTGDLNNPFDKNGSLVPIGSGNGTEAPPYDRLDFFEKAMSNTVSLNLLGGSSKFKYLISANLLNQNGIIPSTFFKRYSALSKLQYQVNEKLSIGFLGLASHSNSYKNQRGSNIKGIMLGLLRTPPSFDNSNGLEDPLNDNTAYELEDGQQRSYRFGVYDNPYWSLNKNPHDNQTKRYNAQVNSYFQLNEKIAFKLVAGVDTYKDNVEAGYDLIPIKFVGSAYTEDISYTASNIDLVSTYTDQFSENILFSIGAGLHYDTQRAELEDKEGTTLLSSGNPVLSNTRDVIETNNIDEKKQAGALVFTNLTYNSFLNVDANLRQDYSTRFGDETRGFLSYGIGLSADLHNLPGTLDSDPINTYTAYINYGRFGIEPEDLPIYKNYNSPVIGGDGFINTAITNGLELSQIAPNKHLTAESITNFDIGIRGSLLSKTIRFKLNYYKEKTDDLILPRSIATSSGYSNILMNGGSITNNGVELTLDLTPIKNNSFSYDLSFSFTKNNNEVESLEGVEEVILSGFTSQYNAVREGSAYGVIIGSGFRRDNQGRMIIGDNGFPLISQDRIQLGDPNPDWVMGIENKITLGALYISALIDIKQGGDVWCGTCGTLDYFGTSAKTQEEVGTTIVFDGVTEFGNPNTQEVHLADTENGSNTDFYRFRYGFGGLAEMNIYDASWVRLRNVSLTYDLSKMVKSSFVRGLSISIYANNLLLISEYPNIDPETNLTGNSNGRGLDYYNNPGTKSYGANIQFKF